MWRLARCGKGLIHDCTFGNRTKSQSSRTATATGDSAETALRMLRDLKEMMNPKMDG